MSEDGFRVTGRAPRNADGTVSVPTVDAGVVRLACPPWCVDGHSYPDGVARVDISHIGQSFFAMAHTQEYGRSLHFEVRFTQWPFSGRPEPVLCVEEGLEFGPPGARKVARALREHADTIDLMARQLEAMREGL